MTKSTLIQAIETNDSFTENGMPTHSTSSDACVDLFFNVGATRTLSEQDIINLFIKALNEDEQSALRILFYNRDVLQGQGERRSFRTILTYLANNHSNRISHLVKFIPEYGRWDDLLTIINTSLQNQVCETIKEGLHNKETQGLCAKWMPRKGTSAEIIRKFLDLSPKKYRKLLVGLSNTVEQKMCSNQWESIEYGKVPSIAAKNYSKAFNKHDEVRFQEYIRNLSSGKEKVNAKAIFPHDIVKSICSGNGNVDFLNQQWNNLPNFLNSNSKRIILPVCDVSGSMIGLPLDVCIALGIYISERNIGKFKDYFITFSSRPQLQALFGNLKERINQLQTANWEGNTNLEAVFDLVLKKAKSSGVSEDNMPNTILILSDMQFDQAIANSSANVFELAKQKYEQAGYKLPEIVFWNLRAVLGSSPVKHNDQGVAMVSGFSPSIMKVILGQESLNPKSVMEQTINSERYSKIVCT